MGYSTTVSAAGFDPDDECSIHSIPAKKTRCKQWKYTSATSAETK